jgi:hypothetical protein
MEAGTKISGGVSAEYGIIGFGEQPNNASKNAVKTSQLMKYHGNEGIKSR